jgi:predicted XRE-type DNA-binding protein
MRHPPPDPIPALKQQLARELVERLDGWAQDPAGSFIGADPSRVSDLRNGKLTPFSLERLIRFVARTKGEVTIQISWTRYFLYRGGEPRTARPGATPPTNR